MKRLAVAVLSIVVIVLALMPLPRTHAAQGKPFSLPFNTPSGLNTWLFEQPYGNTVEAFNMRRYWYKDGQGLHFGIDFETPCETPLVAIADGEVDFIDNGNFGAGPHSLVLRHPDLGYVSVYGHLFSKPKLLKGQWVRRGEFVALSGDPDLNCFSRPHLHLEIHSLDYRTGYDPLTLIDADWNMLYSLNPGDKPVFAKDLYHPNRWQTLGSQPNTQFNNWPVNNYLAPWPPLARVSPSAETFPALTAPSIGTISTSDLKRLTAPGCCTQSWWSSDSRSIQYLDGPDGELASVQSVSFDGQINRIGAAPPALASPDGAYSVRMATGHVTVTRLVDNKSWQLATEGTWPVFSPKGTHLLWHVRPGDYIDGESLPQTAIWIARVGGSEAKLVRVQTGGAVYWLDEDRLLIVETPLRSQESTLSIYTLSTGKLDFLVVTTFLRALSIAPGGSYLMYYLPFQQLPDQSGVYLLETQPGASPKKLPFVGGWRWRDSHSALYIPFGESLLSMWLYNLDSGQQRRLTDPATIPLNIALADWHVSPDGGSVAFVSADDDAIWLLHLPATDPVYLVI